MKCKRRLKALLAANKSHGRVKALANIPSHVQSGFLVFAAAVLRGLGRKAPTATRRRSQDSLLLKADFALNPTDVPPRD